MTLKQVLKDAQKKKYAIGQFNFATLEQLRGILKAAWAVRSPVILGTSEGELSYLGLEEVIALIEIAKNRGAKLLRGELSSFKRSLAPRNLAPQVFLNLDHGKDLSLIKKAIDYGYSTVHFDGSDLPLEKYLKYGKKIVEYAHKKGVLVEGDFPGVDSFTVEIGNVHGMHRNVKLDFEKLKEINKKTKAFLVMHGGSGIPDDQVKKAIKLGIVKININTELRLAWKRSLAPLVKTKEIKPYKILPKVQKAIQRKVEEKIKLFGTPRY